MPLRSIETGCKKITEIPAPRICFALCNVAKISPLLISQIPLKTKNLVYP